MRCASSRVREPALATDDRANLIGSLWMVAAMAVFAVEDALIKSAAKSLPTAQILLIFGLGGAALFAAFAKASGQRLVSADVMSRPMRVRMGFEIVGRLFYTLAITLTPLSATTVILQATPLVVVASAALIFGERVGPRRWLAILIGLLGVLIILQPGTESFSAMSLLAVTGMLGFAGRDLASRAAPRGLGTAILGFYGFLGIVIAGVIYGIWDGTAFVWPNAAALLFMGGAVLAGVGAYACLMKAMRTGEVSAVTPFRYSRLLFGIAFGVIFFGESLGPAMLVGSALIVCSGLFILWRGRQMRPRR